MTRVVAVAAAAFAVGCGVVDTVSLGGGHVESTGASAPALLFLWPTLQRGAL